MLDNKSPTAGFKIARSRGPAKKVFCACGCGTQFKEKDNSGRKRNYVSGHNGRKYQDSEASRWAVQKRYAKNNPDKIRDAKRKFYRARKVRAIKAMGNRCFGCGIPYDGSNAPIFEFHHIDHKNKDQGITRILTNKKWSSVLKELVKCMLLCSYCHNLDHGGRW